MEGPTLTMAPAVEGRMPVHRSHSTRDRLQVPERTPTLDRGRSASVQTLPVLPTFEIPSFELGTDLDMSFRFERKMESTIKNEADGQLWEGKTDCRPDADMVGRRKRPSRTRSMLDRRRSWFPGTFLGLNQEVDQEADQDESGRSHKHVGESQKRVRECKSSRGPEKSKSVGLMTEFAKRSWITASAGSTCQTDGAQIGEGDESSARPGRSNPAVVLQKVAAVGRSSKLVTDTVASRSADSPSRKSRTLDRASVYLTRLKHKPQNGSARSGKKDSPSAVCSKSASDLDIHSRSVKEAATGTVVVPGPNAGQYAFPNDAFRPPKHRNLSTTSSSDTDTTVATSEKASQETSDTVLTMPHVTYRDPLWNTFRLLDSDFSKFLHKNSTSTRMAVVRSTLVPFLRSTAGHPSNTDKSILQPEDVGRRARVLNKWWIGLMEMLDGGASSSVTGTRLAAGLRLSSSAETKGIPTMTNLQPVGGVDRPTLLEAATMLMTRPEWRMCTSCFQPLAERDLRTSVRPRVWTDSSGESSDPDSACGFVAEGGDDEVRTMFVINLLTQMSLVVDKMSSRHAPLSLVHWCGKACAYAFFFVPGIADVLVRLLRLRSGDLLRRVADECGLARKDDGKSEEVAALFPPHLSKLCWTSSKAMMDQLRRMPELPLLQGEIRWHGPLWISRWTGGDTDLFFIFCKYFYVLAEDFLPLGLPLVERARAPAFVLINAQLLLMLDGTIQGPAVFNSMSSTNGTNGTNSTNSTHAPPLSDPVHGLDGLDAALVSPPMPASAIRGLDQNRLVLLPQDILSEQGRGLGSRVRDSFAEAFMAVIRAAAKRTRQYHHAACFALCDFLQEVLPTFADLETFVSGSTGPRSEEMRPSSAGPIASPSRPMDYVDWPFWLEVCRMMMDTNNTLSEMRIISFLFSVWDAIVAEPSRKEQLCLGWLLTDEVFYKFFNNWCPMVRSYYMRLLCWRLCRDTGSSSEVDMWVLSLDGVRIRRTSDGSVLTWLDSKIFLVVSDRLKTVWSHHLWLKQDSEAEGRLPPSAAPCHPSPGKRFMIVRSQVQTAQAGLMLASDSYSSSTSRHEPARDFGAIMGNMTGAASSVSTEAPLTYKKRWSLLGKVLSFTAAQASPGANGTSSVAKRTWDEELEQARRDTAAARTWTTPSSQSTFDQGRPRARKESFTHVQPSSDSGSSTSSSPVYDAATYVFRFTLAGIQTGPHAYTGPQRDRMMTCPRLPAPAQARLDGLYATANRDIDCRARAGPSEGTVLGSHGPKSIMPGLPPSRRVYSGNLQAGLIGEARNARPLRPLREQKAKKSERLAVRHKSPTTDRIMMEMDEEDRLPTCSQAMTPDPLAYISLVQPVRPTGMYAAGAVYTGRALAEWSLVVNECNNFVDRRREEGVLSLDDVEVPLLGVEGYGTRGRA